MSIESPFCDNLCDNKSRQMCQYCDNGQTGSGALDRSKQVVYNIRESKHTSFKDYVDNVTV